MFVALVLVIMLVVGLYMLASIVNLNNGEFNKQLDKAMSGEFIQVLGETLAEDMSQEQRAVGVNSVISAFSSQLGLSEQRHCAVLSAVDASKIVSTEKSKTVFEKTPNIIEAMSGKTGRKTQITASFMDYAYYLDNGDGSGGYIVYVKDNKKSVNDIIQNIFYIIIQASLFAVLAAILLSYFLSKTITNPISVLTEKAEDFADGNFDSNLEVFSHDEIGTLVETFNYMGRVMNSAINEVAGEKHKLEIILEHINNGIMAFNTEQEIILINSAAKKMFSLENVEDIRFDSFFDELNLNLCMAEFMYLEKFRTEVREIEVNKKYMKAYFVPFKIENDKVAGVVCVLEDVTEEFNLEKSRRKFVAEVSHELKTPLTTIGAYTETMLDSFPEDKTTAISFLTTIQNETNKMTNLVKNLLTLSKFDAQSVVMNREAFKLEELVADIAATFKVEAENKKLEILFNTVNEMPPVYADKFQIERAVKNIISNSIKYTPENGCIKIFVGYLHNEAYIKIEDNGIGIPEEDLSHIFERFYRVDKARSREQGGTGLGLAIAKEIIENHNGKISMESKVGEYTKVTIKLPVGG